MCALYVDLCICPFNTPLILANSNVKAKFTCHSEDLMNPYWFALEKQKSTICGNLPFLSIHNNEMGHSGQVRCTEKSTGKNHLGRSICDTFFLDSRTALLCSVVVHVLAFGVNFFSIGATAHCGFVFCSPLAGCSLLAYEVS